jgi:uncharacterized membrane protein
MSVVFPLLCGVMALLLLMIGLRGILTKKPFVISGRWGFAIVLLTFSSVMFDMVDFPVPVSEHVMQVIIRLLILIMCIFVLRLWYLNSRGYAAFGVTDTSFREGLLHSLRKLNFAL